MLRLSILFPVYDLDQEQSKVTLAAFHSVVIALKPSLGEIVVVDDDSPCATAIETIAGESEIPTLIRKHKKRLGLVSSLNDAAESSSGDILTYCHTDCIVKTDAFLKIADLLTERREAGMVISELYFSNGELQQVGGWIGPAFRLCWSRSLTTTPQRIHWGDFWSVRREIYLHENGLPTAYDPGYWECVELGARVRDLGYSTLTCPGSRVVHLKSRTFHRYLDETERNALFERNRWIFASRWSHWQDEFSSEIPGSLGEYDWR
jgi:GT2 family glycosyltransferase